MNGMQGYFSKKLQAQLQDGSYFNNNTPPHDGYLWLDVDGKQVVVTSVAQVNDKMTRSVPIAELSKFVRRLEVGEHERMKGLRLVK